MKERSPELQQRIDNRETELQMAYDLAKYELACDEKQLKRVQDRIAGHQAKIDQCIKRAKEQDALDIL